MIIRNKKTGETREIPAAQAAQFGVSSASASAQPQVSQASQQPQEEGRLLGGALPFIGGSIGGLGGTAIGGLAGGIGAIPGGVAGAAAGAGAGYALEDVLSQLLGKKKQATNKAEVKAQAAQNLKTQGTEVATAAVGELVGAGIGKALKWTGNTLGKLGIKTALPEAAKEGSEAFTREAIGKGKQLSTEIFDRGIVGNAKSLTKQADKAMKIASKSIDDLIENLNKTNLEPTIEGIVPQGKEILNKAQNVIASSLQEVITNLGSKKGTVSSTKMLKSAAETVDDIWSLQKQKSAKDGWRSVVNLLSSANTIGKGQNAADMTTGSKMVWSELGSVLRNNLEREAPELAEQLGEYGFFERLMDAAGNRGSKSMVTPGRTIPFILGTGAGGVVGGLPGAMTGAAAAVLPFDPLAMTSFAQFMKLLGRPAPAVGGFAGQVGAQALTPEE